MTVYEIICELRSDSSRLKKEEILRKHADNEDLKMAFKLAQDPMIRFHIRQIPDYNPMATMNAITLTWAMEAILANLSTRKVTGHAARDYLKFVLSSISYNSGEVIKLIIQKDLDCGVKEKTTNKIWPGLISTYEVMKASNHDKKLLEKMVYPAKAELKADGIRMNVFVRNSGVEYFSANGNEYDFLGIPDIDFKRMAGGQEIMYDGEGVVLDAKGKILPRKKGNGIINKAKMGTISEEEASRVRFILWDRIPIINWIDKKYSVSLTQRQEELEDDLLVNNNKSASMIKGKMVSGLEEAEEYYAEMLADDEEGIILKRAESIWEPIRSKEHVKFKADNDTDLRCIGYNPGTGKYEGMIGSLLMRSECGRIVVNVGSGLSDDDRKKDPKEYLDKICTIKYNAKIEKDGNWSLFLPRFIEVRTDKDIADSFDDMK